MKPKFKYIFLKGVFKNGVELNNTQCYDHALLERVDLF